MSDKQCVLHAWPRLAGVAAGLLLTGALGYAQPRPAAMDLTVDAIIKLRQAELQKEFLQRMEKFMPPAPVAATPVAKAASAPASLLFAPVALPPKRVAAIYGRLGAEVADIDMPSGQVLAVRVGAYVDAYRVIAIDSGGIELMGPASVKAASQGSVSANKAPAGAPSTQAQAQLRDRVPARQEAAQARRRVPLGGTFD